MIGWPAARRDLIGRRPLISNHSRAWFGRCPDQGQQRCCVSCMYDYEFPVVGNFVESCTLSVLSECLFQAAIHHVSN